MHKRIPSQTVINILGPIVMSANTVITVTVKSDGLRYIALFIAS